MTATPPAPRIEPRRIEQLGRVRVDPYAWMKDDGWRDVMQDPSALKPEIRAHLEAENAYCAAVLGATAELQATLFEEMKGRIRSDDASPPEPDGPFDYASRFEDGAQHPRFVRRPRGQEGPEEVLLDVEARALGLAFLQVAAAEPSPDHRFFVWAEDDQGSERHRVLTRDLSTGEILPDPALDSSGDFAISPCSQWIFWVWRDDKGRPARLYRRPVRGGEDALVYEETDPGFFLGVRRARSGAYVLIVSANQETSETRLLSAADPAGEPRLVEARREGVLYDLEHWNDRFVVRTNRDGAVDFALMWAPQDDPAARSWTPFRPFRPGVYVTGVAAWRDWLVVAERENANDRLVVIRRDDLNAHAIAFSEEAYALQADPGREYASDQLRFVYASPTTPRQWFDYDMGARTRRLIKTQEIPSGHDPDRYVTRRLTARASDGAEIPMTVLMRRDLKPDGAAPALLYGYGAYGHALSATFSIRTLSLVDRGVVYAVAHVRGGSEKGFGWFLDGRRETKTNSFTDFVACAEALVEEGLTTPGRIAASGGSAGGLLVGAALNLRPDLWGAVVAAVPFVDVLNTMSDVDLPLTPPEWPEWGDPLTDPAAYDRIAAYSPYDAIKAGQPYPPVLATAGLSDPRVTYWEPAKWIARLRAETKGGPFLLRTNLDAGHGGAAGRYDFLKEICLEYAFVLLALGRGAT